MAKKHWIKAATSNKGALHRKLGVPTGDKIPDKKLAQAAHSDNPKERAEASLARTLEKFHHKPKSAGRYAEKTIRRGH